jgi:glycosyltransferase involved in cell wall biosynthesis
MEQNKILTIIIPTYNMEKYLRKCLDSLIVSVENMQRLEVLVVNDGSKDASSQIAHEYEVKYPQTFRVIDKENGGHGSAWNVGVELAMGKYIRFLDSDDWLDNGNLEKFIGKLSQTQADLVFTHRNRYYEDSGRSETDRIFNIVFDKELRFDEFDLLNSGNTNEITNFWFSTYRAGLLKKLHPLFLEKIIFDDGILFVAPLLVASTFVCYDMVIYNYLLGREGQSMDPEVQKRKLSHRLKVQKSMIDFVKAHPTDSVMKQKFTVAVLESNINGFTGQICQLPRKERNQMLAEWIPYVLRNAKLYQPNRTVMAFDRLPLFIFDLFIYVKNIIRN